MTMFGSFSLSLSTHCMILAAVLFLIAVPEGLRILMLELSHALGGNLCSSCSSFDFLQIPPVPVLSQASERERSTMARPEC